MPFRIESRHLGEVVVVVPEVFADERGFFLEAFRTDAFNQLGLPHEFAQDNHSHSKRGVIRGLHFQWEPPMCKLMLVTRGRAYVVAVDIRKGSPTLGQWFGLELSEENRKMVWAPAGFARGFLALADATEVEYKCTSVYNPKGEGAIRWDDPKIGIQWPAAGGDYILSEKDRRAPTLAEWLASPNSAKLK